MTVKIWGEIAGSDYTGVTDDTKIVSGTKANTNFGQTPNLTASTGTDQVVMVKLDFLTGLNALITSSAEIDSATLYMQVNAQNGSRTVYCHRIKRDWIEGTKNNGGAATGEPTWNYAKHNQVAWTTVGAQHTNDIDTTATDSKTVSSIDYYEAFDVTVDVKDMFDTTVSNYGWQLKASGFYVQFDSQTHPDTDYPYLSISYTVDEGTDYDDYPDDGIELTDSSTTSVDFADSISDGFEFTDSAAGAIIFNESVSDVIEFSDSVVRGKSGDDGIEFSDSATFNGISNVSISDGLEYSDSSTNTHDIYSGPYGIGWITTDDTWIDEAAPTENHGTQNHWEIDDAANEKYGLAYFDFVSDLEELIVDETEIVSALVTISVYNVIGTQDLSLYKLRRTWNQTDATWIKATSSDDWATPGAKNTSTDYYSSATDSIQIASVERISFSVTADIKSMISGSIPNNGWIFKTNAGKHCNVWSRDYGTSGERPELSVIYQPKDVPVNTYDGVELSDVSTITGLSQVVPSDGVEFTDSSTTSVDFGPTSVDGVKFTDSSTETGSSSILSSDGFAFGETIYESGVSNHSVSDGVLFSEDVSGAHKIPTFHEISDGVLIGDTSTTTVDWSNNSISDGIVISDSNTGNRVISASLTDGVVFEDHDFVMKAYTIGTKKWGENSTDDYTGVTKDTYMWSRYSTRNFGVANPLKITPDNPGDLNDPRLWASSPLIKIDFETELGNIIGSQSSAITYARLYLNVSSETNKTTEFYRVKRDWGEGNKDNGEASTGEATWTAAKTNQVNWGTLGALASTDIDLTPITSKLYDTTGWGSGYVDLTDFVKDVIDGTYSNYGWKLKQDDNSYGATNIFSREATDGLRPYLEISYEVEGDFNESISDGIDFTQYTITPTTVYDSISAGITFSDEASGAHKIPTFHNVSDGFTFGEVLSNVYNPAITDGFTFGDGATKIGVTNLSISDGFTFSEDVSGAHGTPSSHTASGGMVFTDSSTNLVTWGPVATDGIVFSEIDGTIVTFNANGVDGILFSDNSDVGYSMFDSFIISDSAVYSLGLEVADSFTFSDAETDSLAGQHKTFTGAGVTFTFTSKGIRQ